MFSLCCAPSSLHSIVDVQSTSLNGWTVGLAFYGRDVAVYERVQFILGYIQVLNVDRHTRGAVPTKPLAFGDLAGHIDYQRRIHLYL